MVLDAPPSLFRKPIEREIKRLCGELGILSQGATEQLHCVAAPRHPHPSRAGVESIERRRVVHLFSLVLGGPIEAVNTSAGRHVPADYRDTVSGPHVGIEV